MKDLNTAKSILRLDNLYIDQIDFKNSGIASTPEDETTMQMEVKTSPVSDTSFSTKLILHVECKDSFTLRLSTTGIFSIEGGLNNENAFYKDNAVAIMFPYLRSQITLLTTQPNMQPIVLPPINIHALLAEADQ